MATTWDSGDWRLSNGGLTATSPDNNERTGINTEFASTPIPKGQKTYYEFQVSGAAIQTAFGVGFGELGASIGNINTSAEGVNPSSSSYDTFSYNRTITNGGYVVSDPENNAHGNFGAAGAAPNAWANGATIGVEVDRIDNTVTYTLNGQLQGTFPISAMANETLYPMVTSWFRAGPQATLIADPTDTPAGYTNLDASAPVATPPAKPQPPTTPAPQTPPPVVEPPHTTYPSKPIPGPSTSGANPDTAGVVVDKPQFLSAGTQTITGHETGDLTKTVFLDWHTFGLPAYGATDWVAASVNQTTGAFSAQITIDHPGISSTLFAHAGHQGPIETAWSATPT